MQALSIVRSSNLVWLIPVTNRSGVRRNDNHLDGQGLFWLQLARYIYNTYRWHLWQHESWIHPSQHQWQNCRLSYFDLSWSHCGCIGQHSPSQSTGRPSTSAREYGVLQPTVKSIRDANLSDKASSARNLFSHPFVRFLATHSNSHHTMDVYLANLQSLFSSSLDTGSNWWGDFNASSAPQILLLARALMSFEQVLGAG